jgi:hypothetical protein
MTTTAEPIAPSAAPHTLDELRDRERAALEQQAELTREDEALRAERLGLALLPSTDTNATKLAAIDARRATISAARARNAELLAHLHDAVLPAAERQARAEQDQSLAAQQAAAARRARRLHRQLFVHLADLLEQIGGDVTAHRDAVANARRLYDDRRRLAGPQSAEAAAMPEPETTAAFMSGVGVGDVLGWGELLGRLESAAHGVPALRAAIAAEILRDDDDQPDTSREGIRAKEKPATGRAARHGEAR